MWTIELKDPDGKTLVEEYQGYAQALYAANWLVRKHGYTLLQLYRDR
jgi:hypothetical protein